MPAICDDTLVTSPSHIPKYAMHLTSEAADGGRHTRVRLSAVIRILACGTPCSAHSTVVAVAWKIVCGQPARHGLVESEMVIELFRLRGEAGSLFTRVDNQFA